VGTYGEESACLLEVFHTAVAMNRSGIGIEPCNKLPMLDRFQVMLTFNDNNSIFVYCIFDCLQILVREIVQISPTDSRAKVAEIVRSMSDWVHSQTTWPRHCRGRHFEFVSIQRFIQAK
jgi:hypothetical protein